MKSEADRIRARKNAVLYIQEQLSTNPKLDVLLYGKPDGSKGLFDIINHQDPSLQLGYNVEGTVISGGLYEDIKSNMVKMNYGGNYKEITNTYNANVDKKLAILEKCRKLRYAISADTPYNEESALPSVESINEIRRSMGLEPLRQNIDRKDFANALNLQHEKEKEQLKYELSKIMAETKIDNQLLDAYDRGVYSSGEDKNKENTFFDFIQGIGKIDVSKVSVIDGSRAQRNNRFTVNLKDSTAKIENGAIHFQSEEDYTKRMLTIDGGDLERAKDRASEIDDDMRGIREGLKHLWNDRRTKTDGSDAVTTFQTYVTTTDTGETVSHIQALLEKDAKLNKLNSVMQDLQDGKTRTRDPFDIERTDPGVKKEIEKQNKEDRIRLNVIKIIKELMKRSDQKALAGELRRDYIDNLKFRAQNAQERLKARKAKSEAEREKRRAQSRRNAQKLNNLLGKNPDRVPGPDLTDVDLMHKQAELDKFMKLQYDRIDEGKISYSDAVKSMSDRIHSFERDVLLTQGDRNRLILYKKSQVTFEKNCLLKSNSFNKQFIERRARLAFPKVADIDNAVKMQTIDQIIRYATKESDPLLYTQARNYLENVRRIRINELQTRFNKEILETKSVKYYFDEEGKLSRPMKFDSADEFVTRKQLYEHLKSLDLSVPENAARIIYILEKRGPFQQSSDIDDKNLDIDDKNLYNLYTDAKEAFGTSDTDRFKTLLQIEGAMDDIIANGQTDQYDMQRLKLKRRILLQQQIDKDERNLQIVGKTSAEKAEIKQRLKERKNELGGYDIKYSDKDIDKNARDISSLEIGSVGQQIKKDIGVLEARTTLYNSGKFVEFNIKPQQQTSGDLDTLFHYMEPAGLWQTLEAKEHKKKHIDEIFSRMDVDNTQDIRQLTEEMERARDNYLRDSDANIDNLDQADTVTARDKLLQKMNADEVRRNRNHVNNLRNNDQRFGEEKEQELRDSQKEEAKN